MENAEKLRLIKIMLLLISSLFLPLQLFSTVVYFIPAIYISFIVPYLIWKTWLDKTNFKINKYSLILKIPIIIFLAMAMFYVEMGLIFIFATSLSLIDKIIIFILILLLIRCVTYAMMIFIWQSDILIPYRKLIYTVITAYCLAVGYLAYSTINAPDTDNYSIPRIIQQKPVEINNWLRISVNKE